jgi:hypothetical protein
MPCIVKLKYSFINYNEVANTWFKYKKKIIFYI